MIAVVAAVAVGLAGFMIGWMVAAQRARQRAVSVADQIAVCAHRLGDDGTQGRGGEDLGSAVELLDRAVTRVVLDRAERGERLLELERALDAIPQGVVVFDRAGEAVFRNQLARSYESARHGDALVAAVINEVASSALAGVAAERAVDLFGPPRRHVVVSAVPVHASDNAVGAVVIVQDVTERRRLDNVRRDFVANISHELKTPIGALALLAETLVGEQDPEVTRRLAERMVSEALRVNRTIDDLLELTRIENEHSPAREALEVAEVVREAVERIRPAAEQAEIPIVVHESPERLEVLGDRRQLVSAVYNLLDNAVKYSASGSAVEVRAFRDDTSVSVAIEDRGTGIPAKDLDRIFERFYRVDAGRSRETGGTGLGLAIVRHIAENHGGEVRVRSRLGEGSVFTLVLPAAFSGNSEAASSGDPEKVTAGGSHRECSDRGAT